jgi:hypothetical protein
MEPKGGTPKSLVFAVVPQKAAQNLKHKKLIFNFMKLYLALKTIY